jgi:hypothetical protein
MFVISGRRPNVYLASSSVRPIGCLASTAGTSPITRPSQKGRRPLPAGLADPQRRARVLSGGGSRTRSYTRRRQTSNHDESIKKEHE